MSLDINLHAEFLLHIRSVTLYATVRNEGSTYQEAYVSADRTSICVSYNGKKSVIALPLGIRLRGTVGLPVSNPAEISLRLEIVEDGLPSHASSMAVENDTPWSASQLTPHCQLACKSCSTVLVPAHLRHWKDLPRRTWTETLDHWYCDRPLRNRDAGAEHIGASGMKLEDSTGLVDICHITLPWRDVVNVEVSFDFFQISE